MQRRTHRLNYLDLVRYIIVGIGFGVWLFLGTSAAANPSGNDSASDATAAWRIDADRIHFNGNEQEYVAEGQVRVQRHGYTLTAETVRFNQKSREALALGNVRLVSDQDVLWGDRLKLNLDNETGTLTDGSLFISRNHLYISADQINKTGPQTYTAERVSITSCDGPEPDWRITGRDLRLTIEGYGVAKHTAMWAGKIPLLYTPYLVFPVKLKRQSGLLMPTLGYSTRKGSEYLQPIFWAISENSDATFYGHYMTERGLRSGLEYRYILDDVSFGTFMVDGLEDRRVDDGQSDHTERWGYDDDAYLRPNEDRYWVRMKSNHSIFWDLTAKLDIDVVSDQDYLHEFKSATNGFSKTENYFQNTFGREIDDYNDPVRLNRLNLSRTWSQYAVNTDLRWYDDVIKRRRSETDDTLQQMPAITFDGIKQQLGPTPLFYDLASSYIHYYRIDGTRGQRVNIYPRLYYPFYLFDALSVEPSAGIRQTAWHVDHWDTSLVQPDKDDLYRNIYDLKLDISTEFYRVFDFHLAGSDRLKHAIIPEIVYEFTPDEDQSEYPEFDELDQIEGKNQITYGFTNTFTARFTTKQDEGPANFAYNPFLRFELVQIFDVDKYRDDDPEPFSNIFAELDLTPGRYIAIDSDAQWSPYAEHFKSFNTTLKIWDNRGDRLTVDYRYTREKKVIAYVGSDGTIGLSRKASQRGIETIGLKGNLNIGHGWRLRAGYELNLYDDEEGDDDEEIETTLGLSYQSQCWGVILDFSLEDGDRDYRIEFNLLGLGSLNN